MPSIFFVYGDTNSISVTEDDKVFVMLAIGGSNCGESNASPCYRVIICDLEDSEFNVARRQ